MESSKNSLTVGSGFNTLREESRTFSAPWYRGVFSLDSFLSAYLTMFCSIVGSGMLSLPYAFQISGWPLGAAALFLVMGLNLFTSYLLMIVAEGHHAPTLDMLTHHVFKTGSSSLLKMLISVTAQLALILLNYGTLVSYFVVVRDYAD